MLETFEYHGEGDGQCKQERKRYADGDDESLHGQRRYRVFQKQPVRDVPREERTDRADQKDGIGRPAIERDAGQDLVHAAENRRVPTKRIEQDKQPGDCKEAYVPGSKQAAEHTDNQQHEGQRPDVNHPHVLGDIQSGPFPEEAWRAPVIAHFARRAEEMRDQGRYH